MGAIETRQRGWERGKEVEAAVKLWVAALEELEGDPALTLFLMYPLMYPLVQQPPVNRLG